MFHTHIAVSRVHVALSRARITELSPRCSGRQSLPSFSGAVTTLAFAPTVGLGCRSLSFIIHGVTAIFIMFFTITSTILTRISETRDRRFAAVKALKASAAITLRRNTLLLAFINAMGPILLQSSNLLDHNTSVTSRAHVTTSHARVNTSRARVTVSISRTRVPMSASCITMSVSVENASTLPVHHHSHCLLGAMFAERLGL